ncbi:hypothetical protein JKP88DRAFT_326367 [Tribonema minus]|uniref:Guanylate cyclase domain-containing protein n=1 Tax=Tribonema minus TaxID=303371 RepID=A0A835YZX9_9STRA|nr:hypothetical protein JKP88DRAFT_326367 [Tribonema minus]
MRGLCQRRQQRVHGDGARVHGLLQQRVMGSVRRCGEEPALVRQRCCHRRSRRCRRCCHRRRRRRCACLSPMRGLCRRRPMATARECTSCCSRSRASCAASAGAGKEQRCRRRSRRYLESKSARDFSLPPRIFPTLPGPQDTELLRRSRSCVDGELQLTQSHNIMASGLLPASAEPIQHEGGRRYSAKWRTKVKAAVAHRRASLTLSDHAKRQQLQVLASFLPRAVLEDIAILTPAQAANMEPACRRMEGAVVVLFDLCSFTKLAEGLRRGSISLQDAGAEAGGRMSATACSGGGGDGGIGSSYASTLLSASLLRLQSTEEAQAGYGAEKLQDLLKALFQELMEALTEHGGDVIRLAGDALIALFHNRHEPGAGGDGGADVALLRRAALASALALQRLNGRRVQGLELHLRAALGVGPVDLYTLGDRQYGWHYTAVGEPFNSLDTALDDGVAGDMVWQSCSHSGRCVTFNRCDTTLDDGVAGDAVRCSRSGTCITFNSLAMALDDGVPGDMVVSAAFAAALLNNAAAPQTPAEGAAAEWAATRLASGNTKLQCTLAANDIKVALASDAARALAGGGPDFANVSAAAVEAVVARAEWLEGVVRSFVLPPVLHACAAEASGWFAELHRVAIIFVNIVLDCAPDLATLQGTFAILQRAMHGCGGVIKEFSQDDKVRMYVYAFADGDGIVMVGAVGLQEAAGPHRAARACAAALQMAHELQGTSGRAYIGISMGQIWALQMARELQGTSERAFIGIRLGQAWVEFASGGSIAVKGKAARMDVYLPLRCRAEALAFTTEQSLHLVGHTGLRRRLLKRVEQLSQGERGGLVILRGAPGMGKTALLRACVREWQDKLGAKVAVLGAYPFVPPAAAALAKEASGGGSGSGAVLNSAHLRASTAHTPLRSDGCGGGGGERAVRRVAQRDAGPGAAGAAAGAGGLHRVLCELLMARRPCAAAATAAEGARAVQLSSGGGGGGERVDVLATVLRAAAAMAGSVPLVVVIDDAQHMDKEASALLARERVAAILSAQRSRCAGVRGDVCSPPSGQFDDLMLHLSPTLPVPPRAALPSLSVTSITSALGCGAAHRRHLPGRCTTRGGER